MDRRTSPVSGYAFTFAPHDISPDGNFIIEACRNIATNTREICVSDLRGRTRFPLTNDPDFDQHPAWFEDASGVWIVYASYPTTLNAFPEIRRVPFTGSATDPIATPVKIADRCIDPVAEFGETTWYLFCTHYQIAGWEGIRMLAPMRNSTAQAQPLPIDDVTLNLGVRLIDAGWYGSYLRLGITRYGSGGAVSAVLRFDVEEALSMETVRVIQEPLYADGNWRTVAISPNGLWILTEVAYPFGFGSDGGSTGTAYAKIAYNINTGQRIYPTTRDGFDPIRNIEWVRLVPTPELALTLEIDPALAGSVPRTAEGAYVFTIGQTIPLLARVTSVGSLRIDDPVRLTLTVPRGLRPQGMTIAEADQSLLDAIFNLLAQFLGLPGSPFQQQFDNGFAASGDDAQVTFTYVYSGGLISSGQPLPITLDVVGQVTGQFLIQGRAEVNSVETTSHLLNSSLSDFAQNAIQEQTVLLIEVGLNGGCTVDIEPNPSQSIFAYDTPLDALRNTEQGRAFEITGRTGVHVINVSSIDRSIAFGGFINQGQLSLKWFYGGGGNAILRAGDCNQARILNHVDDPSIQISNDGMTSWTAFERQEIAHAIDEIGAAFQVVSGIQPTTALEAFNRVFSSVPAEYPPFVLMVRGNSTTDSEWHLPNSGFNDSSIPDVTITFVSGGQVFTGFYIDINNGNCKAFEAFNAIVSNPNSDPRTPETVFMPSAIVCNGITQNYPPTVPNTAQPLSPLPGEVSQHTITHEFGHIFDYGTVAGNANGLIEDSINGGGGGIFGLGSFLLGGCSSITTGDSPSRIMGGDDLRPWVRGYRGWGSAEPFSTYLQSPEEFSEKEAAADLFLNWVYRTNRNGLTLISGFHVDGEASPSSGCIPLVNQSPTVTIPETWLGGGFYNRAPDDNQAIVEARFDWSLSGDIRHALMNDIMSEIFDRKGW